MKKNLKNKKGFSLVEVLAALFVLSMGIVGTSVLMAGNIRTSANAKNQIIAAGLAQEGSELVDNLRRNNSSFTGAVGDVLNGSDYKIGVGMTYAEFKASNDPASSKKLFLAGSGVLSPAIAGLYYYSANPSTATKFSRKVAIQNDPVGKQFVAVVFVTWDGSGVFPAVCNVSSKCMTLVSVFPDLN